MRLDNGGQPVPALILSALHLAALSSRPPGAAEGVDKLPQLVPAASSLQPIQKLRTRAYWTRLSLEASKIIVLILPTFAGNRGLTPFNLRHVLNPLVPCSLAAVDSLPPLRLAIARLVLAPAVACHTLAAELGAVDIPGVATRSWLY